MLIDWKNTNNSETMKNKVVDHMTVLKGYVVV